MQDTSGGVFPQNIYLNFADFFITEQENGISISLYVLFTNSGGEQGRVYEDVSM